MTSDGSWAICRNVRRTASGVLETVDSHLGTMSIRAIVLAAVATLLLASPSDARTANEATKQKRTSVESSARPILSKNLREAKQQSRLAVIPADVRQKRYLALTDGDEPAVGVLTRRACTGDAISDGP